MSRAINYEVFIGPTKLRQDSSLATRDPFSLYHIIHLSLFHHVSITTAGPMRPVVICLLCISKEWRLVFRSKNKVKVGKFSLNILRYFSRVSVKMY